MKQQQKYLRKRKRKIAPTTTTTNKKTIEFQICTVYLFHPISYESTRYGCLHERSFTLILKAKHILTKAWIKLKAKWSTE